MPLTVGTAGHIDHGKTWLVRALTGKDTDRLPEEQARGFSIDLGYARLELPDGRRLSLVDVPGHERFVRTMFAGATGIDLFLLVIDAQEGVRPQTLEHLAVLRLLGVDRGVVAVTKADAVDAETSRSPSTRRASSFPTPRSSPSRRRPVPASTNCAPLLRGVPVPRPRRVRLRRDSTSTASSRCRASARSPQERCGRGRSRPGSVLRIEPQGTTSPCPPSVQVHDTSVDRAEAGQRVAVNLPACLNGASLRAVTPPSKPGHYPVSFTGSTSASKQLEEVPAAVTVHVGTKAVPARVVRDGEYAQLRLRNAGGRGAW